MSEEENMAPFQDSFRISISTGEDNPVKGSSTNMPMTLKSLVDQQYLPDVLKNVEYYHLARIKMNKLSTILGEG